MTRDGARASDAPGSGRTAPQPSDRNEPVTRIHLVDQVVDRLRESITRGKLAPGERLPPEATLSNEFGVGRSTVREALRILRHLGLITTHRGSGSYVHHDGGGQQPTASDPSPNDLPELIEFRETLENEIAELAAQRRTAAQLARILDALEDIHAAAAINDAVKLGEADARLHLSIAAACGNRYLHEIYVTYRPHFGLAATMLIDMQDSTHIGDVHDDLVDAIAARDVRAASAAVRRTFDEIKMRLKLL